MRLQAVDGQPIPNLPRGWQSSLLNNIARFKSGGTPSKEVAAYWGGPHPWVSPKDVKAEVLKDSQDHISDLAISNGYELLPLDTIIAVVRSGILAHTIPLAFTAAPLAINQDIRAIIVDKAVCSPRYLFRYLQSLEQIILKTGVKRGATVHSMRSNYLETIKIVYPEDLNEQERIADDLDARLRLANELQQVLKEQMKYAKALPTSILQSLVPNIKSVLPTKVRD